MSQLEKHDNWLLGKVDCLQERISFVIFNFYGPIKIEDKYVVWKELSLKNVGLGSCNFILVGDFNATLALEEKVGGSKKFSKTMDDFREFVNDNKLIDVVTSNGFFNWSNRRENFTRISERLDRFLINLG